MATKNVPAQAAKTQVVQWQEQLAKEAAAAASTEAPTSEFVSFRGGILSWAGQPVEGNRKNVIVLDSAYEHAFYPHAFDPDAPRSPDCWAVGRVESELTPDHEDVENKQADACEGCPMNEWGSDLEGGRGKACKNVRRVALIDADILNTEDTDVILKAPVQYAKIPVTSGKNYSAYVIQIANVTKRPLHGVISELVVSPDPRTQLKVTWQFVDSIPDWAIPALMQKREKLGDAILFPYQKNEEPAAPAKPTKPAATAGKYAAKRK